MKKMLTAVFAIAMTIMCVSAQPPEGGPQGGGPRGPMKPEQMVEQLDKQLSLTEEQKTKLTEIYTKQTAEMQKMFEEGERPEPEQMKEMMDKHEAAVKAVLTDEQKTKYEQMRKERRGGPRPGGPGPEGEGPRPEGE